MATTSRINIKYTMTDGSTASKSFQNIPGEINIDSAKTFATKFIPLVKATEAVVTVNRAESADVETN